MTTRDGTAVSYQTRGRGEPLVLLAGQANSHRWWDGVRQDFEDDYRTITFDYRGTGASDSPDVPYSTRGFAADVIAILDDLGVGRAHVYGTSMGGRVAQWLAADHPGRVGSLILGCSSPGGAHGVERDNTVRKSLAQPDRQAARRALLELMYTPAWLADHPGPHNTVGDPGMPDHARRRHLAASAGHDAWDALPRITAPTLVIHGTDDLFNPAANAPLLAGRVPGALTHLIPGARHAYFEEFRHLAGPAVLAFLASGDRAG
ncbi:MULTISPECIES: alpha/beta fold hydrolase [Streptosporangium]|uniref:Pimeloyl-ACP methyl ester carboxylesterase n=1 Tax=Streptosporangium brasiliense TaxID=47480 RepID=A0ABT9RK16_9ACTN|nr:alpha/beta fold hydrolase [Streptosporangium brasiliense]MDP9869643.1 pimeloyl-ACP methyl ester carboxylesterase [Streptosporangium brasiliense]